MGCLNCNDTRGGGVVVVVVVFLPIIIPPQQKLCKLFWVVGWVVATWAAVRDMYFIGSFDK